MTPGGKKIKQLDDYRWEVPLGYRSGMRVPGRIYADKKLIDSILQDQSIEQVANATTLPGIQQASLAMPDIHFGYGLPIGGVVATRLEDGIISPGATGYDINCGVRLIRTNLKRQDLDQPLLKTLVNALYQTIPAGVGSTGRINLSPSQQEEVLADGASWAVKQGYGTAEDLEYTEAGGCLAGADPGAVSQRAHERGKRQLGSLGSGNHFVEIQYVEEIYDAPVARKFGLFVDQITLMIHSGSRGLGHQVCTDYLVLMDKAVSKYNIQLPDRQLACAPFDSPEGQRYLAAMRGAANYAWANRQLLMHWTRQVLERVLKVSPKELGFSLVYDLAHNIIKLEEHTVGGKKVKVAVHRKGATRAYPAGHPEVPAIYRQVGQPVLIPGDMGRSSFVLVGTPRALEETFASTCHGAGRMLSRHAAIRAAKGRAINRELEAQGIIVRSTDNRTLKEEMPEAYKDVSQVVEAVHGAGISLKVAKLRPMGVVKG
jgi:tRNA-splicing ligase RtcB